MVTSFLFYVFTVSDQDNRIFRLGCTSIGRWRRTLIITTYTTSTISTSRTIYRSWLRICWMIWPTWDVLPLMSITYLFHSPLWFTSAEDEMDVSSLNLGMIAVYYNISCGSYFSHPLALHADRQILRHHGWGLYTLIEGTHKTQEPCRSYFIFGRIRNYSYPSTRGEPGLKCGICCKGESLFHTAWTHICNKSMVPSVLSQAFEDMMSMQAKRSSAWSAMRSGGSWRCEKCAWRRRKVLKWGASKLTWLSLTGTWSYMRC